MRVSSNIRGVIKTEAVSCKVSHTNKNFKKASLALVIKLKDKE